MFGGAGARVRGRLLRDRGRDPNAGGDHGTPLVLTAPPGDEGVDSGGQSGEGGEGGIKLDIGIPIDFGGDDTGDVPPQGGYDPSEWVRDSSGMTYRSPTNHEMERNGWDARTILVVPVAAELTALRNAALTTLLHLPVWEVGDRPLTDLRVTPFQLGRNASQAMPFILAVYRASQVSRRTIAPIVNLYSSPGLESGTLGDAALVVVASDRGGIEAQGFLPDTRFTLRGPYPTDGSIHAIELAPPGGSSIWLLESRDGSPLTDYGPTAETLNPEVGPAGRLPGAFLADTEPEPPRLAVGLKCNDGFDNDLDGIGDACDFNCAVHPDMGGLAHPHTALDEYGKAFAVIGDPGFCDSNPGNWVESLAAWSGTAEQYLNTVEVPSEVRESFPLEQQDAIRTPPFKARIKECITLGSKALADACHADEEDCPESYPFAGATGHWDQHLSRAWAGFDSAITGLAPANVHPVSIVVVVTGYGQVGIISGELAGRGVYPTTEDVDRLGAAIAWSDTADDHNLGITIAHEIGHTVGLRDEVAGDGFMLGNGMGYAPTLAWEFSSIIPDYNGEPGSFLTQAAVWGYVVGGKWFPRPSGFKATFCDDSSDFTFPGTTCQEAQQWCQ